MEEATTHHKMGVWLSRKRAGVFCATCRPVQQGRIRIDLGYIGCSRWPRMPEERIDSCALQVFDVLCNADAPGIDDDEIYRLLGITRESPSDKDNGSDNRDEDDHNDDDDYGESGPSNDMLYVRFTTDLHTLSTLMATAPPEGFRLVGPACEYHGGFIGGTHVSSSRVGYNYDTEQAYAPPHIHLCRAGDRIEAMVTFSAVDLSQEEPCIQTWWLLIPQEMIQYIMDVQSGLVAS